MDVQHDKGKHKFYIPLEEGGEAILAYSQEGNVLDFAHTYVPPTSRQKGVAEKVVEAGFRYAQENNFKVIPSCPYVSQAFLRKHKEFLPLIVN